MLKSLSTPYTDKGEKEFAKEYLVQASIVNSFT